MESNPLKLAGGLYTTVSLLNMAVPPLVGANNESILMTSLSGSISLARIAIFTFKLSSLILIVSSIAIGASLTGVINTLNKATSQTFAVSQT